MKQDGRRVVKFEKQVQEIIAEYFLKGIKLQVPGLITVSRVVMPKDLRSAKVFVSIYGEEVNKNDVIESIQARAFEIQKHLGVSLKSRYCPKLKFMLDESLEKTLKVEKILDELSKK